MEIAAEGERIDGGGVSKGGGREGGGGALRKPSRERGERKARGRDKRGKRRGKLEDWSSTTRPLAFKPLPTNKGKRENLENYRPKKPFGVGHPLLFPLRFSKNFSIEILK